MKLLGNSFLLTMGMSVLVIGGFSFLIILDGATNLVLSYPITGTSEQESQECFREFMHHMQVVPKYVVADSAFMVGSWEAFYTHTMAFSQNLLGP